MMQLARQQQWLHGTGLLLHFPSELGMFLKEADLFSSSDFIERSYSILKYFESLHSFPRA
jgi:hypothetical protein